MTRHIIRSLCWTMITKPILQYYFRTTDTTKLNAIKQLYLECPVIVLSKKDWELNKILAQRVQEIMWDI